jgi:serine phosphatase RsbU (regulator of sigma subunit)
MSLWTRTVSLITSLLVATVLATSALLAWTWYQALLAQTEADAVLIGDLLGRSAQFAADARNLAEDAVGEQMIVEATILAHLVAIGEEQGLTAEAINAHLRAITQRSVLDEIWITDDQGHAYLRSEPDIDFTFSPDPVAQPQAHVFWPLLTGAESRVVQETRTREVDPSAFKYAGVGGIEEPRIVQVGFDAEFLGKLRDQVGTSRLVRQVVAGGQIVGLQIVDQNLGTLAYGAMPGWRPDYALAAVDALTLRTVVREERTISRFDGTALTVVTPVPGDLPGEFRGAVLVRLPTDGLLAALREQFMDTALIVLLALVAGALGAVALARNVARPVAQLTLAVAAIKSGKFAPALLSDVAARKDELGELAVALEDYARLSADQVRQAVVQYELSRAWEIQSKLLPTVLEGWPGALELAVHFRPARETSGDFYDVLTLPLPDAGLVAGEVPSPPPLAPLQIAVADVAGKGIAAALVMALARATLRTIADSALGASNGQVPSPATTMSLAGRRLHRDVGQRDFVCCALAVVEPPRSRTTGPRMRLANGGQVPPILCRAGEAQELEPTGERFPLGVLPDPEFAELVVDLAPGDVVVFASDGLPEAPARAGLLDVVPSVEEPPRAPLAPPTAVGELFGFERLAASAVYWTAWAESAEGIAEGMWSDVTDWSGETSTHDDMTLLVMRVPTNGVASAGEVPC